MMMHETGTFSLIPHPDFELGYERKPIDYCITLPQQGINDETGLLLVIDGFGGQANSYYQATETRPVLADLYNCLVVGVNYFGIERATTYEITNTFYTNLNRIYGLGLKTEDLKEIKDANLFFLEIAKRLLAKGIVKLDVRCQPVMVTGKSEYQSWGVLPALDCLTVVGELLKKYPLNKKRMIVYGHTYGAYIAQLVAKFAPNTFSVIVDKGGYVKTELEHVVTGELLTPDHVYRIPITDFPLDFEIAVMANNPWTLEDDTSDAYFSDAHRKIRSLLVPEHCIASDSRYYIFHGEDDGLVPVADKERYVNLLEENHEVYFQKISAADVAKGDFKSADNSLGMSHVELFSVVAKQETSNFAKPAVDNDFSLQSNYKFACGDRDYSLQFNADYSLQMSVNKKRKNKTTTVKIMK